MGASHKDLLHNGPKSKIQNPQNPKSPRSKIPNPKSPNPKSKIPQIQNPKSPKSKIQNPRNLGPQKDLLHNGPKSKIKNPKIGQKSLDFGFWIGGFWILDFGPKIQNPKSPRSKIQNPKSEIPKIQNPKSPKSPKSKIFRQNPKFGALGASHKDLLHNDPKSKIQNSPNPKFGDFGFWILDLGDFGFWILGILDFGFWGFWILDFAAFGAFGEVQGCTTSQFGDGAWRSEARIPPGPPFRDSAKPTLSDIVGARKQIELQKPGEQEVKTIFYTFLHDFKVFTCMFKLLLQHNYPNSKIQTNSIWYSWKRIAKCFFKIRRKGNQEYNFHDFWVFKGTVGLYVPVDGLRHGEIARVGGHRRQPVLNIRRITAKIKQFDDVEQSCGVNCSNQARTNHSLLVMWLRQTSLQSCMLRVWLHSAHVKMVTA